MPISMRTFQENITLLNTQNKIPETDQGEVWESFQVENLNSYFKESQ